ncbi:MAG: hypothetical protein ACJAYB_000190, partial [Psychromonas sp.]
MSSYLLAWIQIVSVTGKEKFGQAIRLCRLHPQLTSKNREGV